MYMYICVCVWVGVCVCVCVCIYIYIYIYIYICIHTHTHTQELARVRAEATALRTDKGLLEEIIEEHEAAHVKKDATLLEALRLGRKALAERNELANRLRATHHELEVQTAMAQAEGGFISVGQLTAVTNVMGHAPGDPAAPTPAESLIDPAEPPPRWDGSMRGSRAGGSVAGGSVRGGSQAGSARGHASLPERTGEDGPERLATSDGTGVLGAGEVALPAEAQAQTRASRALEAGDFEELEEAFEEEEAALQANIKEKRQRSFGTFSALDRR